MKQTTKRCTRTTTEQLTVLLAAAKSNTKQQPKQPGGQALALAAATHPAEVKK